ncbi:MAG: LLM class flavin-dependent oxidoreductase [Chloroflexota bacterium]|nr:LLM class flavin-dependent oxidoreductase [Chloroflexota bacterium]MDE2682937.1 LLM class flavin-dependent oxidoreductase [Chloroflexota bacterium]
MSTKRIGIHAGAPNAEASLDLMRRAEAAGAQAAWLTTGGTGLDALTLFSAAAVQTDNILFGTSIVPTYPRHPIVVAQQAQVIDQLAPGRLRIGVGPSHRPPMRAMFGFNLRAPLTNLREYLQILRALLQEGSVDFDGQEYTAHASISRPVNVPVMASALQEGSYELCGELADGAISWVSPAVYLRDKALPAMRRGSDQAGRETPPLIAHAPVCISTDSDATRLAVQQQLSNYPRLPFYQQMWAAAGYPEAAEETWSDGMIEATVFTGDADTVGEKMVAMLDMGIDELLVTPVTAGDDPAADMEQTIRLLGKVAQSL